MGASGRCSESEANPESVEAGGVKSQIGVRAVGDGASGKISSSLSSAMKLR